MIATGLAVDGGRAYVVKAQLTKAVDGAALSAARNLNSGSPRAQAEKIFRANFPDGYMGVSSVTNPTTDASFFDMRTDDDTGVNIVTVRATAVPDDRSCALRISSRSPCRARVRRRRMVDLARARRLGIDVGSKWPAVRDAAREFINSFDASADRMSLTLYSYRQNVRAPNVVHAGSTGGDESSGAQLAHQGVTAMPEGLYRGWDELRTVPTGQQSGLRVIVLFTDGSGNVRAGPGTHRHCQGLFNSDFPDRNDPDNITNGTARRIQGLYDTAREQPVHREARRSPTGTTRRRGPVRGGCRAPALRQ